MSIRIHELLKFAIEKGASDIHVAAGEKPAVRRDGEIMRLDSPPLTGDDAKRLAYSMMPEKQRIAFENPSKQDPNATLIIHAPVIAAGIVAARLQPWPKLW